MTRRLWFRRGRGCPPAGPYVTEAGGLAMTVLLAALQASCAAIATMGFFRIIDPVLYPHTIGGHGPEKHDVLCPFSAQVRPKRIEAEARGIRFDLPSHTRPGHQCARGPSTASHSNLHKKMGQRHVTGLPRGQCPQRKEIDMSTVPRRSTGTVPIKNVNEGGSHAS